MIKKTWVGLGAVTVLLVCGGGAALYLKNHNDDSAVHSTRPGSLSLTAGVSGEQSKTVPISNDTPKDNSKNDSSNSLKVTPSQDTGQTGIGAQSAGNSRSSSSPSDGDNSSKTISPASFGEYDKYKDQSHSLFGEMVVGGGADVVAGRKVAVNYKGWLINGQLFDQNKEGTPFVFIPGEHRVIVGWEEGVIGMKVGGKRLLIVPPAVGYGSAGKDSIPPNALMVFEIEVLAVQP